jgi:hypothetical protein
LLIFLVNNYIEESERYAFIALKITMRREARILKRRNEFKPRKRKHHPIQKYTRKMSYTLELLAEIYNQSVSKNIIILATITLSVY